MQPQIFHKKPKLSPFLNRLLDALDVSLYIAPNFFNYIPNIRFIDCENVSGYLVHWQWSL